MLNIFWCITESMQLGRGNLCALVKVLSWYKLCWKKVELWTPLSHSSLIASGTGSSQSTLCHHSLCSKIFTLMMVGANHPRTSNVLATSEKRSRFVRFFRGGTLTIMRWKWSVWAFHSTPSVLVYWSGEGSHWTNWTSLSSVGIFWVTFCRWNSISSTGNHP